MVHALALFDRGAPFDGVGGNARRPKSLGHVAGVLDIDAKGNGALARAEALPLLDDFFDQFGAIAGIFEPHLVVVAAHGFDLLQVGHPVGGHAVVLHSSQKAPLLEVAGHGRGHQGIHIVAQLLLAQALGGRGHHQVHSVGKGLEHRFAHLAKQGNVAFVVEHHIGGPLLPPASFRHGLNTGDLDRGLAVFVPPRLDKAAVEAKGFHFFVGLAHQHIEVHQKHQPLARPFRMGADLPADNGLARAGTSDDRHPFMSLVELAVEVVDQVDLVGAELGGHGWSG